MDSSKSLKHLIYLSKHMATSPNLLYPIHSLSNTSKSKISNVFFSIIPLLRHYILLSSFPQIPRPFKTILTELRRLLEKSLFVDMVETFETCSPEVASIHLFSDVPIMLVAILVRLRILCLTCGREGWSLPQSFWYVEDQEINVDSNVKEQNKS